MQHYTIGLLAKHRSFKRPTAVKVFMKSEGDGVRLTVESAHNLAPMPKFGSVLLAQEEFENRPQDAYDSTVEAIWALSLFGISI